MGRGRSEGIRENGCPRWGMKFGEGYESGDGGLNNGWKKGGEVKIWAGRLRMGGGGEALIAGRKFQN